MVPRELVSLIGPALSMPGAGEWAFILFLAAVVFGPARLPDIARSLGKAVREFQIALREFDKDRRGPDSPA